MLNKYISEIYKVTTITYEIDVKTLVGFVISNDGRRVKILPR